MKRSLEQRPRPAVNRDLERTAAMVLAALLIIAVLVGVAVVRAW